MDVDDAAGRDDRACAPGARFTADAVWGKTLRFMFTACPIGFRPSVPFTLANKEAISLSLYNCVASEPTS